MAFRLSGPQVLFAPKTIKSLFTEAAHEANIRHAETTTEVRETLWTLWNIYKQLQEPWDEVKYFQAETENLMDIKILFYLLVRFVFKDLAMIWENVLAHPVCLLLLQERSGLSAIFNNTWLSPAVPDSDNIHQTFFLGIISVFLSISLCGIFPSIPPRTIQQSLHKDTWMSWSLCCWLHIYPLRQP